VRRFAPIALAATALAVAAPGVAGATPAASAPIGAGCQTVHVGPTTAPGQPSAGYFELTLQPGRPQTQAVLVANPNPFACRVLLQPAQAQTAGNSGETYPPIASGAACIASSCWLTGLPATVTVPANGRVEVPFTVHVPAGTRPGEYLAGVVAEPADPAAAPSLAAGSGGRSVVGARVVARVALGVAVTVPGPQDPEFLITGVRITGSDVQGQPIVAVTEFDGGNTWDRPAGTITIDAPAGKTAARGLALTSATVLPGDSATLSLAISGVSGGRHTVHVVLGYDNKRKQAVWTGSLVFPTAAGLLHVGNSTVVSVTGSRSGIPTWLIGVIAALGTLVLFLLSALLFLLTRRRRRRKVVVAPGKHAHGKHRAADRELASAGAPRP
jgi:hypothetical protein